MDFKRAVQVFEEYLDHYDRKDDKIELKIIHTYGVVSAAEYLSKGLHLSEEDADLARMIALLHDIGRFEQLRRYDSFDDSIVPHAQLSLEILFSGHMIGEFLPERNYDGIIYTAIKNHGLYRMESGLEGRALLHSQIIRDADKMDNYRVKDVSDMVTMVDVTEEELGREDISDHIYRNFLSHTPIVNSERKTHMDMWVSYLGYIFDFNFSVGLTYLKEHDYITKLVNRVPYSNEDTKKKMAEIYRVAMEYISG